MTRTEKYQNSYKKHKKVNVVKILVTLIKNIGYLAVGTSYSIYSLLKMVNNLVVKGFNKLPRLAKVGIIYSLIALAIFGIVRPAKVETIVKETIVEITNQDIQDEEIVEDVQEEIALSTPLFDNDNANNIYDNAINKGLTQDQAILCVAISAHETGWWKSTVFVNNYNFGGIMKSSNTLKSYESYNEGLDNFTNVLKNYYFDLGLTTIQEIGNKYCPIGASNDPTGLNNYWVGGVTNIYNSLQANVK